MNQAHIKTYFLLSRIIDTNTVKILSKFVTTKTSICMKTFVLIYSHDTCYAISI